MNARVDRTGFAAPRGAGPRRTARALALAALAALGCSSPPPPQGDVRPAAPLEPAPTREAAAPPSPGPAASTPGPSRPVVVGGARPPAPTPAPAPSRAGPGGADPTSERLLAEGCELNAKGDFAGAADRFRAVIVHEPRNLRAHYDLGVALENARDLGPAGEAFERALAIDPKLAAARLHLAAVRLGQADRVSARKELEAVTDGSPALAAGWIQLAALELAEGRADVAARTLERGTRALPQDAEVAFHLALAREAARDGKGAVAAYEKALELDPGHARAANNLAVLLETQGPGGERPLELWRRAQAADPRYADAPKNLGAALYKRRDQPFLALEPLERALALGTSDPRVSVWIGEIEDAVRTFRTDDRAFAVFDRVEADKLVTGDGVFPIAPGAVKDPKALRRGARVRVVFESATSSRVLAVEPIAPR